MKFHDHLVIAGCGLAAALGPLSADPSPGVGPVPDKIAIRHKLDRDFYKKHADAGGIPVLSSEKVRDEALLEVRHLVLRLLAGRDDIRTAMAEKGIRIGVMAHNEFTTSMPETRGMNRWWDKRARGLGGNPVTCAEENVLNFEGDPYVGENIFIHEFAHAIHHTGLRAVDEGFDARLRALFEKTKKTGRFSGYCMQNFGEFWAEGVQSWFDCNRREIVHTRDDGTRQFVRTRAELEAHLPEFATLLREVFGDNPWRYTTTGRRIGEAHLAGFDRRKAPVFSWPEEVLEAFAAEEARRNATQDKKRRQ